MFFWNFIFTIPKRFIINRLQYRFIALFIWITVLCLSLIYNLYLRGGLYKNLEVVIFRSRSLYSAPSIVIWIRVKILFADFKVGGSLIL